MSRTEVRSSLGRLSCPSPSDSLRDAGEMTLFRIGTKVSLRIVGSFFEFTQYETSHLIDFFPPAVVALWNYIMDLALDNQVCAMCINSCSSLTEDSQVSIYVSIFVHIFVSVISVVLRWALFEE